MINEWSQGEDNLFSANHRNLMIVHHGGTMASIYTVGELEKEYKERSGNE